MEEDACQLFAKKYPISRDFIRVTCSFSTLAERPNIAELVANTNDLVLLSNLWRVVVADGEDERSHGSEPSSSTCGYRGNHKENGLKF